MSLCANIIRYMTLFGWHKLDFFSICIITLFSCTQQNEYVFVDFSWYEFSLLYNCALAANSYSFLSLRNLAYEYPSESICRVLIMSIYAGLIMNHNDIILSCIIECRKYTFHVYGIAALDLTSWFIWIIVMFTPFIFQHVYSIFNIYFFFIYMAKHNFCFQLLDDEFMMEQQGLFAKPTTTSKLAWI
ncbi:hypothetical protein ACJX0J_023962, partial [Zea mays]